MLLILQHLHLYYVLLSKTGEIEINVSNPIYNSNNKYLCIAESKGNNIYLVSGGNLLWQTSALFAFSIEIIFIFDCIMAPVVSTSAIARCWLEFINTLGWLQKKYKSKQEISNIVLGSSVAGVVYRDRVEIINL